MEILAGLPVPCSTMFDQQAYQFIQFNADKAGVKLHILFYFFLFLSIYFYIIFGVANDFGAKSMPIALPNIIDCAVISLVISVIIHPIYLLIYKPLQRIKQRSNEN